MAENTAIEWADATWSPWEGCTKVGPGCDHCYAEAMNRWLRKGENWGPGAPRRIYSEEHWGNPFRWQRDAPKFHTLHGRNRRVFPSVCDPFDNEAPGLHRERLFATIRATPALTWLLLTKRIGNAKSMLPADWGAGYPNVWLGSTVVTQEEADRDVPKLLAVPARVRFLSVEPMLGPVDLSAWIEPALHCGACGTAYGVDEAIPDAGHRMGADRCSRCGADNCMSTTWGHEATEAGCPEDVEADQWDHGCRLHWLICGGESGPHARPMHPDWARSLRDQCAAAGVPFLFKQWGEWAPAEAIDDNDDRDLAQRWLALDGREVNPDHGVDFFHGDTPVYRAGKKAAGRLLDGIEHNGFPA